MNNLPAVDGLYPVVVGGAGLASLAVPESPRTGVYYASLGGTVVIRNVDPATVVSQLETTAASWLTSMGLAMDDPATAEMAINMVRPEAIAVSAEPQPFLSFVDGAVAEDNVVIYSQVGGTDCVFEQTGAGSDIQVVSLEQWASKHSGIESKSVTLVYTDETHATLTKNGFTYTFVFDTQTVRVFITPYPTTA